MSEQEAREIYAALLSMAKHYQDLRADILKQAAVYERMLEKSDTGTVITPQNPNITYTTGSDVK